MNPKQISIVISTKISDDTSATQKITDALESLYSITYNELTDDIWQAIKLLQKVEQPKVNEGSENV
ncbi:hypothetical protein [Acinetobacter oleivorans]|uniref:hypothetical protein n=1 Tax=Acinetobacter oleivorans TaxID=1148157 RepID=UPI0020901746|nr:hypothetical protein [Acinetobacter oleivorans]